MKYFKLLLFFRIFLSPYWKQFSAAVNEILDFVFFLVFQRQTSIIPLHLLDFFFFALLDVVKTVHKLWLWFSEGNLLFRLGIQQWWIKFNSFSTPHENKFSRYKSLRWILSKTNSFTFSYYVQLFSVLYLLLLVYMFLFFFPCLPRGNVKTLLTWNLWIIVLWIRKSKSSICIPTSWKSARRKRVYAKGKSERCGLCKKMKKKKYREVFVRASI